MARSQIPVTEPDIAGVAQPAQTTADASNKHYIAYDDYKDGNLLLEIVSSDAGSQTVTLKSNPDLAVDGLTVGDRVITVAAGATRYVSKIRPRTYKQTTDVTFPNSLHVDPSVSTNLKFRAYRVVATT